jgi:hypothetical protein
MLIVAMVAPLWGQTPAAKPGATAKQTHWHKYVNKEFGFSLWYPGGYRADAANIERRNDHNDHRGYLLHLTKRDNPGVLIAVTIILAVPFSWSRMPAVSLQAREELAATSFIVDWEAAWVPAFRMNAFST